jgi:hypothetical protein
VLLTISEYCAKFRCSRSWLYAEWKEGRGPSIERRGRKILIHADDEQREPERWRAWHRSPVPRHEQ